MTERLWTIDDIRHFLSVESLTTAYKVAARPDAPKSVQVRQGPPDEGGMMDEEFKNAVSEWESHDDWRYADRDAERLFFFKAGQEESARRADRNARIKCAEICDRLKYSEAWECAEEIRATMPEE